MSDDKNENTPRVNSTLSKGLSLLENLANSDKGKGVSQLSRDIGLTKTNTFRLLQSLTSLGYVRQSEDKKYSASLKIWQIGRLVVDRLNLRELCASEMQFLSKETGETVYLAVQEGISVIYLDKIDSLKPIRSWNPVGGSAPMHCVGTGKAILSANYAVLRELVKGELKRYTERTITNINDLDKNIDQSRANGYAYDQGEFRDRINSFGAPIFLPSGEAIAAIGISVPDVNMPVDGDKKLGELVAEAAARASQKMVNR